MKTHLVLGTLLGCSLLAGSASAAVTKYTATLNGAQENPAVTTTATGAADLEFDDEAKTLTGTVTFTGLSGAVTASHIHKEACGANGGTVFTLAAGENDIDIDETLTDAQITDLVAGNLYVNIHTQANGSGEIRGQLYPEGSTNQCPAAGNDAGSSGGTDSGTSGSSSSGGTSDGGATTVRSDAGSTAAAPEEDDGCSTTGSAPGSGVAIAFGVGVALAAISRGRRKR
jgi:CHRD domain